MYFTGGSPLVGGIDLTLFLDAAGLVCGSLDEAYIGWTTCLSVQAGSTALLSCLRSIEVNMRALHASCSDGVGSVNTTSICVSTTA